MSEAFGYTVDELRKFCNAAIRCDDNPGACKGAVMADMSACYAYIEGFMTGQAIAMGKVIALGTEEKDLSYVEARRRYMKYCLPETVTHDQIVRVFVKYINDHPEKLHEQAGNMLHAALQEAFPCK